MDNWKKDRAFSKVRPVKNAEDWHNFGLIMVFLFFLGSSELLLYFLFDFCGVKGCIFDIIMETDLNFEFVWLFKFWQGVLKN